MRKQCSMRKQVITESASALILECTDTRILINLCVLYALQSTIFCHSSWKGLDIVYAPPNLMKIK